MHFKSQKTIILIVSVLLLVFITPTYSFASTSFASNYDRTYTFHVQYGYYRFSHRLYISVPPSLYDYYRSKSHSVSDGDYSKFVTPDAVRSIAESIESVTRNKPYSDEEFANAVLMLVHQVSYVKSNVKYPAETIVDNSGDCDVLSLLAASIMKAGGLDVVLLYYKERSPSHMNVGVYLPYTPVYRTWWMTPTCYEYNGKKYWVAECTSRGDWKVGDRPDSLAGAKAWIISLENCEKSSPAHVSSSLDSPLTPSSISITLSSEPSSVGEKERTLTISGSISPAYSGESVVMYVRQDGSSQNAFRTVFTDHLGKYSLTWNFTSTGTYYIRTSWSGVSNYAGSDSETLTVFIRFFQPLVELEVPEYYWGAGTDYILARASAAAYNMVHYKIFHNQDEKFPKINLLGAGKNVSLSGEFIILRSGQTTNNQFGFILRHNGGNYYSVSVRVLEDYDMFQITKRLDGNDTALIYTFMDIRENTWYKVVARMSEDEITAELYDENGTLLKSIATRDDAISIGEFGILVAYDTDTVMAFKNLKVETLDQPTQPIDGNHTPVNGLRLLAPYIGLTILLAVAFTTVVYVKKRKRGTRLTLEQTVPGTL